MDAHLFATYSGAQCGINKFKRGAKGLFNDSIHHGLHTHTHTLSFNIIWSIKGAQFTSKKEKLRFKSPRIGKSSGISQLEDFQTTHISSLIYIRFAHTKTRRTSLLRIFPLIKILLCFDVTASSEMAAWSDRDGERSWCRRDFCHKREGFLTLCWFCW